MLCKKFYMWEYLGVTTINYYVVYTVHTHSDSDMSLASIIQEPWRSVIVTVQNISWIPCPQGTQVYISKHKINTDSCLHTERGDCVGVCMYVCVCVCDDTKT